MLACKRIEFTDPTTVLLDYDKKAFIASLKENLNRNFKNDQVVIKLENEFIYYYCEFDTMSTIDGKKAVHFCNTLIVGKKKVKGAKAVVTMQFAYTTGWCGFMNRNILTTRSIVDHIKYMINCNICSPEVLTELTDPIFSRVITYWYDDEDSDIITVSTYDEGEISVQKIECDKSVIDGYIATGDVEGLEDCMFSNPSYEFVKKIDVREIIDRYSQ